MGALKQKTLARSQRWQRQPPGRRPYGPPELLGQQGDGRPSRDELSSQTLQGMVIHSSIFNQHLGRMSGAVPGAEGPAENKTDQDCSRGAQTSAGESDDRHDSRKC